MGCHAASLCRGGHPGLAYKRGAGAPGVCSDGDPEGFAAQSRQDTHHETDGGLCLPRSALRAATQPDQWEVGALYLSQHSGAMPRAAAKNDLHQTARPYCAAGMCAAGASGGAGMGELLSPHQCQPGLSSLAAMPQWTLSTLPALSQERPGVRMEALSESCPVCQRHSLHWQQGDQGRESAWACQGRQTVGPPYAGTLHGRWDGKGMANRP